MAAHPPATAPSKLFREEAKAGAIGCPACGGPITLRGFGGVEVVACPYCGSELGPQDNGALDLLQQVQRQRRQSVVPLHQRGQLDGIMWEVLGIVWRECEVYGVVYPWQEFLLYNPYKGYRYLVFSMGDGHWTLGEALKGAPQVQAGLGHKKLQFKKDKFKHFQTNTARVTYVEGEFPWQVHVGDQAVAHEYVLPPRSVSIEEAFGPDGQDVNFTMMEHIDAAAVWKAFGMQGSPPSSSGVGTCEPNPWKKGRWMTWISLPVLLLLWLVVTVVYIEGREPRVVFSRNGAPIMEPYSAEIEVKGSGGDTTLEVDVRAYPLSNQWAYVDVMLISQEKEEAIGFGLTAEEWHGASGGESWREGDATPSTILGGVAPGKYLMQVSPQSGDQRGNTPTSKINFDITVREDVVLARYVLIPFFVIVVFPFIFLLFGAIFEGRRWTNSDYASSE